MYSCLGMRKNGSRILNIGIRFLSLILRTPSIYFTTLLTFLFSYCTHFYRHKLLSLQKVFHVSLYQTPWKLFLAILHQGKKFVTSFTSSVFFSIFQLGCLLSQRFLVDQPKILSFEKNLRKFNEKARATRLDLSHSVNVSEKEFEEWSLVSIYATNKLSIPKTKLSTNFSSFSFTSTIQTTQTISLRKVIEAWPDLTLNCCC